MVRFWCQLASISFPKIDQLSLTIILFSKAPQDNSIFASMFTPFWQQLGAILGLKLEPSWLLKSPKSRPERLPRRIWEPEPAQTPKMAPKWSHRPSKMMPQTLHVRFIFDRFLIDVCPSFFDWFQCSFLFFFITFDSKRGGGYAALLRFGSAAPGLRPAHGV